MCIDCKRAHCIPLSELKSFRYITSMNQETEVGRKGKSEGGSSIELFQRQSSEKVTVNERLRNLEQHVMPKN